MHWQILLACIKERQCHPGHMIIAFGWHRQPQLVPTRSLQPLNLVHILTQTSMQLCVARMSECLQAIL